MPDEFLTVDEVAILLKLNPQTVRNQIDRGEMPAVRIGPRRVRIRRSELEEFLEAGSTGGRLGPEAAEVDEGSVTAEALISGNATVYNQFVNCVGETGVTEYGDPAGAYGYVYHDALVGSTYMPALDLTQSGTVDYSMFYDKCNTSLCPAVRIDHLARYRAVAPEGWRLFPPGFHSRDDG
jgi:excisionase family DNA binding protein